MSSPVTPLATVTSPSLINGLGGTAGFGEQSLARNDDGSTVEIDLAPVFENGLNFFGREFSSLWVNNNGGVTFNGPRGAFTPTVITQNNNNPEITPFFADVDTRGGATTATAGGSSTGSNLVYYDFDTVNDRFIVTWDDVGYYSGRTDKLNAFQLILTDVGGGDFDIEFRYEYMSWTTGNASGGSNGLGGTPARAGFTASTGNPDAYFELPASGNQAALLQLHEVVGNTGQTGIWEFSVRSGNIDSGALPALPTRPVIGATTGDPHLVTLDGVPYDFHAAGEFVLMRATDGTDFHVQSRMTPVEGSDALTVNEAIAARVGGRNVMIDSNDANPFSINGVATEIPNFGSMRIGNDQVFRSNNVYTIVFAGRNGTIGDGDAQLRITVFEDRVDFVATLNSELAGRLVGLLGNADGNAANDVAYADGSLVRRPFAFEDIYGRYRADWRVDTAAESLFTYDAGESLAGFYLPGHPGRLLSVSDFPADRVAAARALLVSRGLTEGSANFDNALLDYLATGDETYIRSAEIAPEVERNEETQVATSADLNRASAGDDRLEGTARADRIDALAGDDRVSGKGGNDTLLGSNGADSLLGGTGNDVLRGGAGRDSLLGHSGKDKLFGQTGNDVLRGGAGADTLNGNAGADRLFGEGGNDRLLGGAGNDLLRGGAGNDKLFGGSGKDRLFGDAGKDVLVGGAGNDLLSGGKGADKLTGGTGRDSLQGGANDGAEDRFIFLSVADSRKGAATRDTIKQFEADHDVIDLSRIDADTGARGNQAFSFAGTTPEAHGVWSVQSGNGRLVEADVTGDGRADFQILVQNISSLGADNFIL